MKIYYAGAYYNKAAIDIIATTYEHCGIEAASSWHRTDPEEDLIKRGLIDFSEIDNSNILVGIYPCEQGAEQELTYAFVRGILTIYYRMKEFSHEDPLITSKFCHADNLHQFYNVYKTVSDNGKRGFVLSEWKIVEEIILNRLHKGD
jgi:hypothetical protein